MNRRDLLRGLAASTSLYLPGVYSLAQRPVAPSDRLFIALIGVGSQGTRVLLDMLRLPEVQVVAVCDVNRGSSDYLDWGGDELRKKVRRVLQDPSWGANFPGPAAGRKVAKSIVEAFYTRERGRTYRGCTAYEDYRELLAREKDLDAVIVSTPDHWHAPIAIAAMRAGKHVYSQKPMAHSVAECREMAQVARETRRATQVSIFNSATPNASRIAAALSSGAIGSLTSIDIWTKRASAFWRQGLPTPDKADPIPDGFNWNMWLGPAPSRPFNHVYLPFVWRAWYDFGCGALGDMGEYGFDTITRAVGLGPVTRIEASTTERFPDCYPVASVIHLDFAASATQPALRVNWYDGGIEPPHPAELAPSADMGNGREGVLYTGSRNKLLTAFMGEHPRLLTPDPHAEPLEDPAHASDPEPLFIPDRPEWGASAVQALPEHYREWIRACHGGPPARANYAFEAPIVEALLLGCIAVRTGEILEWDAAQGSFRNASSKAVALLEPNRRNWST